MSGVIVKQTYEKFPITFDYSLNMSDGETVTTLAVTAVDSTDVDATATIIDTPSITLSGQTGSVKIQAGSESNSPYNISGKCITSLGNKFELDVKLIVEEIVLND